LCRTPTQVQLVYHPDSPSLCLPFSSRPSSIVTTIPTQLHCVYHSLHKRAVVSPGEEWLAKGGGGYLVDGYPHALLEKQFTKSGGECVDGGCTQPMLGYQVMFDTMVLSRKYNGSQLGGESASSTQWTWVGSIMVVTMKVRRVVTMKVGRVRHNGGFPGSLCPLTNYSPSYG
jgi:hypothetical protein